MPWVGQSLRHQFERLAFALGELRGWVVFAARSNKTSDRVDRAAHLTMLAGARRIPSMRAASIRTALLIVSGAALCSGYGL
jgi:hypothetical protein